MLTPGLVSITFRKLTVSEIVSLVGQAGLTGIEWGGDVHVPPGETEIARDARRQTEEAGLRVAAYGSYYRVGKNETEQAPFTAVLDSAVALGAPTIRIWAGTVGSEKTDPQMRARVVEETRRIAGMAAEAGISLSFEFHGNTLTDTNHSAATLLQEVDHPNVFSLWQPAVGASKEYALEGLKTLLPRLTNVHIFSWVPHGTDRLALTDGEERWKDYLELVRSTGRDHYVLMEFVRHDSPEQFLQDAAVLRQWLAR